MPGRILVLQFAPIPRALFGSFLAVLGPEYDPSLLLLSDGNSPVFHVKVAPRSKPNLGTMLLAAYDSVS
jgi:hypothetical protein